MSEGRDDDGVRDQAEGPDPVGRPDLRVGDTDRQAALEALGTHLEAGRLTVDEYGDRSAAAAVAVRRGDLAVLFEDLPAPHPPLPERSGAPARAAEPGSSVVEHRPARAARALPAIAFIAVAAMVMLGPMIAFAAGSVGIPGGGLLVLPLLFLVLGGWGRHHGPHGGHPGRRPGRGPHDWR